MMSKAEADSFFINVLGWPGWNVVLNHDNRKFLKHFVPYYAHNMYFQNISMTAIPPSERHVPDEEETLRSGLKGYGGVCTVQNGFLNMLFRAIGLNSYLVSAMFHGSLMPLEDSHVICIVELNKSEEKYMFDFGNALPMAGPIPLHNLPFEARAAGVRYQYKASKDKPGFYCRYQLDGAIYGKAYEDKNYEYLRYDFSMTQRPLNFFFKVLKGTFTDVDDSFLLQHPFLFRYFEEDSDGNQIKKAKLDGDRKWIVVRGVSVLIGDDNRAKVTHYQTYDEMFPVIKKYFPKLPENDLKSAIQYWNEFVPKYGIYKAKSY